MQQTVRTCLVTRSTVVHWLIYLVNPLSIHQSLWDCMLNGAVESHFWLENWKVSKVWSCESKTTTIFDQLNIFENRKVRRIIAQDWLDSRCRWTNKIVNYCSVSINQKWQIDVYKSFVGLEISKNKKFLNKR